MRYNWQQADWPAFRYEIAGLTDLLLAFADHAGRVGGLLEGLSDELGSEAMLDLMISEAIRSSAIEGETLDREAVMSSIRNRLGLNPVALPVRSRLADGAGQLMVAVREGFREPLSAESLFEWHRMLLEGTTPLRVGCWRSGSDPMQVVSGRIDLPTVHFEAPPSACVPAEMERFITWFNQTAPGGPLAIPHAPVRSAIAHLYFETIHPFEDGNGRIGRALAEKALSQGLSRPVVMSLSRSIDANRSAYYDALQAAQRGNEITPWIHWFVRTVVDAQRDAGEQIQFLLKKSRFFQRLGSSLNDRQAIVLRRMFEAGPSGFIGGMNARKYVALTGASKATATRDLQQLTELGALTPVGSGRSTRYELRLH
jgi:Fic family protein